MRSLWRFNVDILSERRFVQLLATYGTGACSNVGGARCQRKDSAESLERNVWTKRLHEENQTLAFPPTSFLKPAIRSLLNFIRVL